MTEILFSKTRPVLSACRRWNVPDYRSHATEIIGRDPMTDPALIRIEAFVRKIRQYRQGDTVLF